MNASYQIVNVVATVRYGRHLDLYRIAAANKGIEFDEDNRVAHYHTTLGYGKLTLAKRYIGVIGVKSTGEAISELKKIPRRLRLYFIGD